jgi:4,5-DOPA dioxygenase extradiol
MNSENQKFPVLFVGHGSPMNAIENNSFSNTWEMLGKSLPNPDYILCISAHWLTQGTFITAMKRPSTIYDFGGFPDELYKLKYNCPGSPKFAEEVQSIIKSAKVQLDLEWGLDHGAWSVLIRMYPLANIPVLQLSMDYSKPPEFHYELGKELSILRKKNVLILGSGNIVHNLRMLNFSGTTYNWAIEFDKKIIDSIENEDHLSVINYQLLGESAKYSVPTNEHFLPLLYCLGAKEAGDKIKFFNEGTDLGSISMSSVIIGSLNSI